MSSAGVCSGRNGGRKTIRAALGSSLLAAATLLTACNPALENQYYREGIGTAVTNPEAISVTEVQSVYLVELCRQAGALPAAVACEPAGFSPAWGLIVQAGLNDIDARCDAYLAWLDDKRRTHAPILSQISSVNMATQSIMRVAGVGADPITLVGIAFGLASDTFTNIRSRLLLETNHSTVQSIVLARQQDYRDGLARQVIDNRAAAIYALRSYLRLCMPMTIEMHINTTVAIYEQTGAAGLRIKRPLIDPATIGGAPLRVEETVKRPDRREVKPLPPEIAALFERPADISPPRLRDIQTALCVPQREIGTAGEHTKTAIRIFEASYRRATKDGKLSSDEIDEILGQGRCIDGGGRNYFEKRTYDIRPEPGTETPLAQLVVALNLAQPTNPLPTTITTIGQARDKIRAVRALPGIASKLTLPLPATFSDQVTRDFLSALPRP